MGADDWMVYCRSDEALGRALKQLEAIIFEIEAMLNTDL